MTDALPRLVIRLNDRGGRQTIPFLLEPDAAGRAALAADLGILAIRKLRLTGTISPDGARDWRLAAEMGATVVQEDIVTAEPVTTRIDEPVGRLYAARIDAPAAGEVEMPDDVDIEPLPTSLDLGEVLREALALALPAFPRSENAETATSDPRRWESAAPGATPIGDDAPRPFASLATLKNALEKKRESED